MYDMLKDTSTPLLQLLRYTRSLRRDYVAATIYSILNKLFDLMPEVLLGVAINIVVKKEHSWLSHLGVEDPKTQLLWLGLMIMVIYGLESLFEYLYRIKWGQIAQSIQHRFRVDAFNHIQQSTMEAFAVQKTGNLLSTLNEDVNQLEYFFKEDIDKLIELICAVCFTGGLFFFLSPQVASFAILPVPLIL